jgi:glycyl-tRNA synthetase beta chain
LAISPAAPLQPWWTGLSKAEVDQVADAVRDHYKPIGPSDSVPTAPVTVAVALADKLDTLVGFFTIDERPTGSKDPFALRRAGLGVIRILASLKRNIGIHDLVWLWLKSLTFGLSKHQGIMVRTAQGGLGIGWGHHDFTDEEVIKFRDILLAEMRFGEIYIVHVEEPGTIYRVFHGDIFDKRSLIRRLGNFESLSAEIGTFLADRLKILLRNEGKRHDLVDAVFALGDDDLVRIVRRVEALSEFLATEDGANLLAGYKRAVNILKAEEKRAALPLEGGGIEGGGVRAGGGKEGAGDATQTSGDGGGGSTPIPDPSPFEGEGSLARPAPAEEAALVAALRTETGRVDEALDKEDFTAAMRHLAHLRAPVDAFFDKVLVNDPDPAVRLNRLRLLTQVRDTANRVADFSLISG